MNPNEALQKIKDNFKRVISERNELRVSLERKNNEIAELEVQIQILNEEKGSLSTDKNQSVTNTMSSNNEEMNQKIDGLIDEIDECLALLNS